MSQSLLELGFRNVADFWPPWCAAVVDGEIVPIAFAARISEVGAELGVATVKAFRGQGFAAAATAGWSSLSSLQSRAVLQHRPREHLLAGCRSAPRVPAPRDKLADDVEARLASPGTAGGSASSLPFRQTNLAAVAARAPSRFR
jgi:hypothetical protein